MREYGRRSAISPGPRTIGLDATYSVGRNLSGVATYSREILFGLAAAHPDARLRFYYRPHRFLRSFADRTPPRRLLLDGIAPRVDLFHGLNQRLPRALPRHSVSTFHDLFVLTGDYSTAEFRRRFAEQARDAAARSDLIVTVSEFTAGQVEALLGVERARLRVIPHGARTPARQPPPLESREPLILHVGAIQRRKNIPRLIEAFERLAEGWTLVLAGSAGFEAGEILERIERSPRRANIAMPGYVSGEALAALYARASIFAFPSLDEGFGMPVLDAMASGVPVLTSNRSALPEVAGDAALLVDPFDAEAISDALIRLAESEELRKELSERGLRRAAGFSWKDTVERTWRVYGELLGF